MKRTLIRLVVGGYMIAIVLTLVVITADSCHAQFAPVLPDCCTQAIRLQTRLTTALSVLDSTRAVDARIIAATDARVQDLIRQGTAWQNEATRATATTNTLIAFLQAELLRGQLFRWGQFKRIRKQLRALE